MSHILGSILGSETAKIVSRLEDLKALDAPVDTKPFSLLKKDLQVQSGNVSVFGQAVTVDASTEASLEIHAPGYAFDAFAGGKETVTAQPNQSFAELHLHGAGGLAGEAEYHYTAPLALTLGLGLGAELDYRHLFPVQSDQARLKAFEKVVSGSGLPHQIDFAKLAPGEIHELTALVHMDLRTKVTAGYNARFVRDLFEELPSQVRFHVECTANASLGLSLYERLKITAGKALLLEPRWSRLRVERENMRQLTLGAGFSLLESYDLTAPFESLLEQALGLLPLPRAMGTLEKVRKIADEVANSDWDQIKAKLIDEAGDEVTELLGDAGWLNWLADSSEVKGFLALSRDAVEAYDKLDDRLKSLWDRLLGRAGLEEGSKTRRLFEKLGALDLRPEVLLDRRDLIEAVETLSGRSLEEILLGSDVKALQDVRDLAVKALGFLKSAPPEFFTVFESFAERTGIKKAVAWLRDNATSEAQVKGATEAQVRHLVERLTCKALNQISKRDVEQIREWACKIGDLLAAPEQIEAKLRSRIERLKGEIGFSVAVELDRLSRRTAVLDLEFDPSDSAARSAVANLAKGDLGSVLRELPAGKQELEKEAEDFPYRIRECVFTSRRVRTSAANLLFSLFGWDKDRRQQIEEVAVQLTQIGANFERKADYGAASLLTSEKKGVIASGAFWLLSHARGTGRDLKAPYETLDREIRLTYSRADTEDSKTTPEELKALGTLLNDLGFSTLQPLSTGTGGPTATRFTFDFRLPESAVTGFWGSLKLASEENLWAYDVLNAMHRWFDERLVPDKAVRSAPMRLALLGFLHEPKLLEAWIQGVPELDHEAIETPVRLELDGRTVPFWLATRRPSLVEWQPLDVLPISRAHYRFALGPLRRTEELLDTTKQTRLPADLATLNRLAGKGILAMQPSPNLWGNPMLGTWLVISRLSRHAPASVLKEAKGLATLRWKDPDGKWNPDNLRTWSLVSGLSAHDPENAKRLFPIAAPQEAPVPVG